MPNLSCIPAFLIQNKESRKAGKITANLTDFDEQGPGKKAGERAGGVGVVSGHRSANAWSYGAKFPQEVIPNHQLHHALVDLTGTPVDLAAPYFIGGFQSTHQLLALLSRHLVDDPFAVSEFAMAGN